MYHLFIFYSITGGPFNVGQYGDTFPDPRHTGHEYLFTYSIFLLPLQLSHGRLRYVLIKLICY